MSKGECLIWILTGGGGLNSVPEYFAFSTILLKFEVMSVTSLCVCVSKQTVVNKLNVKTKTINLCFQVRNNGEKVPGADPLVTRRSTIRR